MKEKKRDTTTFCGVVVVNDKEALIRRLLDYYNNNTTQKTVINLSDYEKNCLLSLVRLYGEEKIRQCFDMVAASDFLSGRKGCDWLPDFRWIVTQKNFEKIISGKYNDYKYCRNKQNSTSDDRGQGRGERFSTTAVSESSFDPDEFWSAALNRGFSDM